MTKVIRQTFTSLKLLITKIKQEKASYQCKCYKIFAHITYIFYSNIIAEDNKKNTF